jgi:acyl carrier protein
VNSALLLLFLHVSAWHLLICALPDIDTMTEESIRTRIKEVIIESLGLEGMTPADIEDDAPLFGDEGLGLDSVDALELMVVFEKDFGLSIDAEEVDPEAFATVTSLESFIQATKSGQPSN